MLLPSGLCAGLAGMQKTLQASFPNRPRRCKRPGLFFVYISGQVRSHGNGTFHGAARRTKKARLPRFMSLYVPLCPFTYPHVPWRPQNFAILLIPFVGFIVFTATFHLSQHFCQRQIEQIDSSPLFWQGRFGVIAIVPGYNASLAVSLEKV